MPKILVVDDEIRIAQLLESFLTKAGFEVIKVFGGKEAIETILNHKIDLMILNIKMPNMGGEDVLIELQRLNKSLPTIILTASISTEAYLDSLKRLGFSSKDFLFKPVDLFLLLETAKKKLNIKDNG